MQSGVFLLIMAMCLTPGVDVLAKQLTAEHSPFAVAFYRYFAGGLVALCVAKAFGQKIHIPQKARVGQLIRTGLLVGSMICLITAFSMVPLAYAVGGFLISPVVATILGVIFLGEKLTGVRTIGVVLSLAGAIVIARPAAVIEVGTLFALLGGVLLGIYLACTRGSRDTGGALSTLAVQCFIGSALVAPFAFWGGLPEMNWALICSIAGLGVFSAGAHFLTVAAFERADASVLSPFLYFNLISAVIVGYIWFGEVPGVVALIGLFAIVAGGLATIAPEIFASIQGKKHIKIFGIKERKPVPA